MAATTRSPRVAKAAARPTLSRDVVADRAIAVADAEGLDAVTIRRLATELGVTPMALYWHFRTKDELLAGLGERVLETVEMPARTGAWDVDLRAALAAVVTAMRPHPELAELVAEQVMLSPKGLALTELALATLSESGLGPEPTAWFAMRALRTVVGLVTGDPVLDSGMADDRREAHQRQKAARIGALSPKEFPALVAHAEAMAYCSDVDMFVNLGLDHFIAGVKGLAPLT